jgi:hypothetical protein
MDWGNKLNRSAEMYDRDDVEKLELCDLTDWETNFVFSILERMDDGNELSDRQIEVLNNMLEKYEERGEL